MLVYENMLPMKPVTIFFASFLFACATAQSAVHVVKNGASIQEAIERSEPGDILQLEHGYYTGNLVVNKPLTIKGVSAPARPHILGDASSDTILIASPDVTLEDLIIKNSGADLGKKQSCVSIIKGSDRASLKRSDLSWCLFGVYIEQAHHVHLLDNRITGKRDFPSVKRGNGVQLYASNFARIIGNDISFVRDAIYVDVSHDARFLHNVLHHSRYGTHYMNAYRNVWEYNEAYLNRGGLALMEVKQQTVRFNKAWGNSDHGIMLRTIQDSVVEGNIVAGNGRGFFIYDAEFNELKNNLIAGNKIGVHLAAGSKNNNVEANDFIHNQVQVKFVASRDEIWGQKMGNYWSNYTGWDHDNDQRGDTEYEANDAIDRLSWQYPELKLLLASPAIASLKLASRQFPLLRAPSIVDKNPSMSPFHLDWSQWLNERYKWPSH